MKGIGIGRDREANAVATIEHASESAIALTNEQPAVGCERAYQRTSERSTKLTVHETIGDWKTRVPPGETQDHRDLRIW